MHKLNILMVGAHPDDCDFRCGGITIKYVEKGHKVTFMSTCDGRGGHYDMSPEKLAARRREEASCVAELLGINYDIWDIPDCEIMANLVNRKRLVRYIRKVSPDIIFTHRTNDYHADHRNTAILMQDASYLLSVPNFCPDVPAIRTPVIMYFYDRFTNPSFEADIVIPIDDVIDKKYDMFNCHISQVYEWLPYHAGVLDSVPKSHEERLNWLREPRVPRDGKVLREMDLNVYSQSNNSEYREATAAAKYRHKIQEKYGDIANDVLFAEAFQVSEYGNKLTKENTDVLFPF